MIIQASEQITYLSTEPTDTNWAHGVRHDMANIMTVIHLACEILPDVTENHQQDLVDSMILACERGKALLASRRAHS